MDWAYRVIEFDHGREWDLEALLNDMGQAAWELVSLGRTATGDNRFRDAAVFKRQEGPDA